MRTPEEILGVSRGATKGEIKTAFRILAKKSHPDRNPDNPNAASEFAEINGAYETLFSTAPDERSPGGSGKGSRGSDVPCYAHVALEDIFRGGKITVELPEGVACPSCAGDGGGVCSGCGGNGFLIVRRNLMQVKKTCDLCHGSGTTGRRRTSGCADCGGRGKARVGAILEVNIQPGVADGHIIRVPGAGAPGDINGDLLVSIFTLPHDRFQRRGADLMVRVPVPFTTLCLGGKISFYGIDGKNIELTLQPNSFSRKGEILKGLGLPSEKGRGRIFVGFDVSVPKTLSPRAIELLSKLRKEGV
jgi:molecular chaperone DnaJ